MLVTVTNTSGRALNGLDTITGGTGPASLLAVGGARKDPLPYPFGHIGELAIAAAKVLPMHTRDWRYKSVPWLPQEPSIEWQQLVQAGVVTLGVATETDAVDEEDIFVDAVL
jgi:hypothetical protein